MAIDSKYADHSNGIFVAPPTQSRLEAFRTFLYNSEAGSCLGRTPASWAKIMTFYVIFYSCLAGFFAVCMWGLLQTIDREVPKYQLDRSLIGTSPGLSSRPLPPEGRESVMTYKRADNEWTSSSEWLSTFGEFLKEYESPVAAGQECNYTSGKDNESEICAIDVNSWGDCKPNDTIATSPCVYFKLNKVYDWVPEYYKDLGSLPDHMPKQLKDLISQTLSGNPKEMAKVWLSCTGRYEADETNLGEILYYPEQGFPGYFYPFRRQKGFLSPVVAVNFRNAKPDTEISVECRTWSPSMVQDRKEQLGVLNFKIKIE
ncbi:sodium/potassium-transporting ATPase subunit beta-2-like [Periplaneta americana]|uniref:sodium/potassium-transporting ATPase subunit beta-2-like n=1 Tax=Periplaneta americana TaxID=6978 RepID=UPI0037E7A1A1